MSSDRSATEIAELREIINEFTRLSSHRTFDERYVNVLKTHIFHLKYQLSALLARNEAVLTKFHSVSESAHKTANQLRKHIAADVRQ